MNQRGFSLVELLIVVAILTILTGIVTPHLLSSRGAAQAAAAKGDLRTIHSAQISYFAGAGMGSYGDFTQLEQYRLLPQGFGDTSTSYYRSTYSGQLTLGPGSGTFTLLSTPPVICERTPSLFLDSAGTVRYSNTANADSTSFPIGR